MNRKGKRKLKKRIQEEKVEDSNSEKKRKLEKEIDQVKNSEAYFLFSYVEQKLVVSERFHFHFFLAFRKILCPSPNYPTALFGMFILKSFYSCFKENKAVDN